MDSTKTIKGVDEESWTGFKSLAAKNNMKMGEMFKTMVNGWEKKSKSWEKLFSFEKILTDEEAEEMLNISKRLRSESGYR